MLKIIRTLFEGLKYSIMHFKEDPIKYLGYIFPFFIILELFIFSIVIFTSNNSLINTMFMLFWILFIVHFIIIVVIYYKNSTKNKRILMTVALVVIIIQILLFVSIYWFLSTHDLSQNKDLYQLLKPYFGLKIPLKSILIAYVVILGAAFILYLLLLMFNNETRMVILYTFKVYLFLFVLCILSIIVLVINIIKGSAFIINKATTDENLIYDKNDIYVSNKYKLYKRRSNWKDYPDDPLDTRTFRFDYVCCLKTGKYYGGKDIKERICDVIECETGKIHIYEKESKKEININDIPWGI